MNTNSVEKPQNFLTWGLRVHLNALKSASSSIESVVLTSLNVLTNSDNTTIVGALRHFNLFDYMYTSSLRAVNRIALSAIKEPVYVSKELQTFSQQRKKREMKEFKLRLGSNTIYAEFCKETAQLIYEIIPKIAGEAMALLPPAFEMYGLYKAGFGARYLNWKVIQRTNYREYFLNSNVGRNLSHFYCGLRYSLTNSILCKENVSPLINLEHLLLLLSTKISPKKEGDQEVFPLSEIILKSLGKSITHLQNADAFVLSCNCKSEEEAFIARLEWYRQNNILPDGLPDPREVRLNTSNLQDELNKALNGYLDGISGLILDKTCPKKFSNPFLNFFYHLEGKDILKNILVLLIGELGVKQVADPHQFSLAILFAKGIDIADYELDGFGKNRADTILRAGREMMQESLKDNTTREAIVNIYERTGLRQSPESFEGIRQKNEAKELLKKTIFEQLYNAIKEPTFRHSGAIKSARERFHELPILGMATTSLHMICNGLWFSLGYLVRDESQQQIPFGTWMIKHLSGHNGINRLADKIIELLYHPGWRFIVLSFIESITDHLQNRVGKSHSEVEETPTDHMRTIIKFLSNHFSKDLGIPIDGVIDYLVGEEQLKEIQSFLKTSGKPLQEVAMESMLPTIKESLLTIRITNLFRKHSIEFSGDDQFWKFFIREYLNRLVKNELQARNSNIKLVQVAEYTAIRERILTDLLKLSQRELRQFFCPVPITAPVRPSPQIPRHRIIEEYSRGSSIAATSQDPLAEIAAEPQIPMHEEAPKASSSTGLFIFDDYSPAPS